MILRYDAGQGSLILHSSLSREQLVLEIDFLKW